MKQLPYPVITTTDLPGFKLHSKGKVRDIYDIDENTLLLVTTDRMSAFDVILGEPIPWKGVILNQLTLFWMNKFAHLIPNHIIESDVDKYPASLQPYRDQLVGRSVLAKKAQPLKAECIVRGYIAGSGWKSYKKDGTLCGVHLPAGLKESDKLPEIMFTPSTKGEMGTHDENISLEKMREIVGKDLADKAAETSLAVLLGRSPAEIMKMGGLKAPASLMTSLDKTPALPSGIPSQILEHRPDIRQAEANLQAANYDIGTARASFFPSFSLTGLLGGASLELNELLRSTNQYASVGGSLSLPLNFWTIKRTVDSAEAAKKAAVATYELTVQNAFKDVRDALVSQTEYANSVGALTRQVDYLSRAVMHARTRYDNGFASYLELLTAESNLFTAQQSLAVAHANHLVSIAEVCLALGGGWQE